MCTQKYNPIAIVWLKTSTMHVYSTAHIVLRIHSYSSFYKHYDANTFRISATRLQRVNEVKLSPLSDVLEEIAYDYKTVASELSPCLYVLLLRVVHDKSYTIPRD